MSVQCKQCKFAVVAEDTWEGKPVAYFCKLDKYEYEVCDVGMVSPEYSCEEGESIYNNRPNKCLSAYKKKDEFKQEFEMQYINNWTTNAQLVRTCAECEDFGTNGCKSSYIESKYGNKNTPACSDIKLKE